VGPKGATGGPGPTGDTGNPGPTGGAGVQGPTGDTGFVGPTGNKGSIGFQGAQGPTGPLGNKGPQGATGPPGFNTIGENGDPGASGAPGGQGPFGPLGFPAAPGIQGAMGSQGFQGAAGTQGSQGLQGAQGPPGIQGTQGPNGLQGAQGVASNTTGSFGSQGPAGPVGPQGVQGAQGAQGAVGPASVTCTSYTSPRFGADCAVVCSGAKLAIITHYMQTSAGAPYPTYRFLTNANCQSSTCDWDGAGGATGNAITCTPIDYACGYDLTSQGCFVPFYSDVRLKNGIETLEGALENIMKINAVEYDWNKNLNPNMYEYFSKQEKLHTIGLIAQNVRLYYPEAVRMNDDGYYSIDYHKLNSVLVEGIKDLQYEIEEMDKELDKIELILS
jgi:hypothetical protein